MISSSNIDRGEMSRRSLLRAGGAAALGALVAGFIPQIGRADTPASTASSGSATKPATSQPAVLSVDGEVDTRAGVIPIVGRNAVVSLWRIVFVDAPEGGIICNVYFDFVGGDDDAEAAFTLQLLTRDKRVVGTKSWVEKKRVPPEPPEEHGGTTYSRIMSPRGTGTSILNLPVTTNDVSGYHLEVRAK